uniref:Uncharacterized protein n=1 Tax=Avena sativa TaxID=4498 RepID=A0ACD6A8I0_AVESA
MEDVQQAMELDHPNLTSIVNASKSHLLEQNQHGYSGISADIYQFTYDPARHWNEGHTFNGNSMQDLSFEGIVDASDDNYKREAVFLVHGTDQQVAVENMMRRSLSLKHDGILRPLVAGYNTQISKVISAYRMPLPTLTLDAWLEAEKEKAPSSTSIPPEVQQLLWTAYQAIAMIWQEGYTSDSLANPCSYHMIENKIKIDPLCIRDKREEEKDEMLIRNDFGIMILHHIYPVWKDDELNDFVDLVNNPEASVHDILEAPVLLLPASRELMYHHFDKARLNDLEETWLAEHANPQDGWKITAGNADPILQSIIDLQEQRGADFSTGFKGAMHFANVVTAHYPQHFRKSAEAESGVKLEGRVDSLLKQLLPRLLTKRYNSKYEVMAAHQAPQP